MPTKPPADVKTSSVSPLTNPNLTAALRLEYDALVNDMRRAQALSAEFQRQLIGKSTEADEFKDLFAKTQTDLFQLQDSITELREERHRLANEAMRATALSRRLAEITVERDRLATEVESLRVSAEASTLKNATETSSTVVAASAPREDWKKEQDHGVKAVVSEMWRTLDRLQAILDPADHPGHRSSVALQSSAAGGVSG